MEKKSADSKVASNEAVEGSRKLGLSVTRMKKMRSSIKAGTDSEDHGGGGTRPWGNNVELS